MTGDFAGFAKDNMGKAMEHAVAQAVEYLVEQLEDIEWEGTIMMAGDKILCNRGAREGVEPGMRFVVGSIEELHDPDTGELLDTGLTKVAEIEATKVKQKIFYARAVSGGNDIKKGMSVFVAD